MPSQDPAAPSGWDPCASGTISQLHRQLQSRHRRERVVRVGTPLAVCVLLAVGLWSARGVTERSGPAEYHFGGVACSEVQASMQLFVQGRLEPSEQQAFAAHLEQCTVCQELMEAMGHSMALVDVRPVALMASASAASNPSAVREATVLFLRRGEPGAEGSRYAFFPLPPGLPRSGAHNWQLHPRESDHQRPAISIASAYGLAPAEQVTT